MSDTDMESKVGEHSTQHELRVVDLPSQSQAHTTHGIVGKAHLFQEDSDGKVTGQFLLPRPTENPKDPLTWATWRKHLAFTTVLLFVFLSNYITASLSPILVPIMEHFKVDLAKASYLITFNILFLGLGSLLWVPLSLKIGKRPVVLLCSAMFFGSSIWSAVAKSWGSLFGARIIQGVSASAAESLAPAVVADLYFIHERGTKVGIATFAIASGSAIGGIFAGLVASANPDFRWVFWMDSILTGFCFTCTVFFFAETNFERAVDIDNCEGLEASQLAAIRARSKTPWFMAFSLTSWHDRERSIWWLLWRPWKTFQYPAVVWGSLTYGVCLGWVVLQQTANSAAFPEQYGFSELAVGNIGASNMVGAIIGCLAGGPMTDYLIAFLAKRRGGYFKPEVRLWLLIPPFLLGPVGLMLWGAGIGNHLPAMVAITGTGITYGVLCATYTIGVTYAVDSHRPMAGEAITVLTALKNTIAFGVSFAVFPWLNQDGFVKVAGYMVLIEGLLFLMTVPLYIYGERIRDWTSRIEI